MNGSRAAGPGSAWLRHGGWLLAAGSVLYAVLVHHGLGPRIEPPLAGPASPTGFLSDLAPNRLGPAWLLFGGVAVALAVGVFWTSRSAVARFLAVSAVIATTLFVLFGVGGQAPWKFFHWRFSACLVVVSLALGAAATAPLLARAWLQLGTAARVASYAPVFLAIIAIERNITGTDPQLPVALSPWPIVQIFGLEMLATFLAAAWLGASRGLALLARSRPVWPLRVLLAVVVTAGVPVLALAFGSAQGFFPFRVGTELYVASALVSGLVLAVAALSLRASPEHAARHGRTMALGGLLAALPLVLGQAWTQLDYAETRERRAQSVIDALASFYEREGTYPDSLDELAAAGDLGEVPSPQIGFSLLSDSKFTYQSFGTNYLLEFSAPRWVQCAYNPPWGADFSEEEIAELEAEGEDLGGAWSCPTKPPELW